MHATGRAGGKVILLGEHAVVYGRSAGATGLPIGAEGEAAGGGGPAVLSDRPSLTADPPVRELVAQAASLLGLAPSRIVLRVRSELPPGRGLGSSAALAVATLRALAPTRLDRSTELDAGRRLEAVFHGTPSGIDPAA